VTAAILMFSWAEMVMKEMALPIVFLLVTAFLGYCANRVAHSKGRNPWGWTIATVFLLFPVAILLLLPDASARGSPPVQGA